MKTLILLAVSTILVSCLSVKQVGDLNMVSKRNIDLSHEYELKATYAKLSSKELRRSNAQTIEQAIDQCVRKIAGGEFLLNVKIYLVNQRYWAVEGDVYGLKNSTPDVRGFSVGNRVYYSKRKTGIVTAIISPEMVVVQSDKRNKTHRVSTDRLVLIE